ncbi:conserved hypothetical protein [Culex quinquefasciatus]|uniref:Fibronectin type-III domain-containing protein n=1 Tax=Culex quinquefasciatus TaxID=7176 RepID=B0X4T1_CULQU|nr:conserved hypothetical protein [Culex quinquefasciatus]|eukprot:XP_001864653.1 conserved hypothetical protein [Culex quinquefasciatus]
MRIGENGDWDQVEPIFTKGSQSSHQVTGLVPFTVYSFRVVAVNEHGHSSPSKESYYFVTLREAPTGKPVTTIAHNTSATSVYVSWKSPPPETIFGEFLGYRITYRTRDKNPEDDAQEIYIRDSTVEITRFHEIPLNKSFQWRRMVSPTGKPVTTIAHNTSATSVYVSWKSPPPETIFGEFLGYRITYRTRDKNPEDDAQEIYIRDSTVESHEIHNLETYTQYLVSIQVFNPEGLGPPTTVLVMTDEGGKWWGFVYVI